MSKDMGNTLGYPRMTKSRSSNKENEIAIALVYHPRILLAVTVRSVHKKSGNGDRQDAGDSGSCPMKTGPAPDFV